MNTHIECIPCFVRQALQAAQHSGSDAATQERVLRRVIRALDELSWEGSPMSAAHRVHGLVREETGIDDPYRQVKDLDTREALAWYRALTDRHDEVKPSMETAIRLAVAGNIIDYGANANVAVGDAINNLLHHTFAVSDIEEFLAELDRARTIAYLADNAGEIVLDRLLLETIQASGQPKECLVVVRKEPFINDALRHDAELAGLDCLPRTDITSMNPTVPSENADPADQALWRRIRECDVIISKGQGNYEVFSEEPGLFFLLVAKCPIVANDLQARTGSPLAVGDLVLWKSRPQDRVNLA